MIIFHRLLIGTAIVFCGGFAIWLARQEGGNTGSMLLSATFGIAALALGYYLRHLNRFLHR